MCHIFTDYIFNKMEQRDEYLLYKAKYRSFLEEIKEPLYIKWNRGIVFGELMYYEF